MTRRLSWAVWYGIQATVWFFLGALLGGCALEPNTGLPMIPPASYRAVWDSAQACTGLRGKYSDLRFSVIPGDGFYFDGQMDAGYTHGHHIFIAGGYINHPMVVKHEMMHALGIHGHPDRPFKDPCRATWDTWDRSQPALAQ